MGSNRSLPTRSSSRRRRHRFKTNYTHHTVPLYYKELMNEATNLLVEWLLLQDELEQLVLTDLEGALLYKPYLKRLPSLLTGHTFAALSGLAGRVHMLRVEVPFKVNVDAILFEPEGAAGVGNVITGLYEDNNETPQGGSLIAQGAQVTIPPIGGPFFPPAASILPETTLEKGLYWLALQCDRADEQFVGGVILSDMPYYEGVYGVLQDPCPAINAQNPNILMYLRVSEVL